MSKLAERLIDLPLTDDLEAAVDAALATSGGDARLAIQSLILGQRSLMEAYDSRISAGYVRKGLGRR
ncbi:hypothetical protein [Aureimonas sp. N4]|uniref:hypothetical protein n=1 Tax=Aureimonas sp. N4 TaxID=1638165 RepID=UPI000783EDB9|nr:hypothetical protein [Aureimonas sp. N4]